MSSQGIHKTIADVLDENGYPDAAFFLKMGKHNSRRKEKIAALLRELQFEVTRGLLEDDLGDNYLMSFSFLSPEPKSSGFILSRFEMRRQDYIYPTSETLETRKP